MHACLQKFTFVCMHACMNECTLIIKIIQIIFLSISQIIISNKARTGPILE